VGIATSIRIREQDWTPAVRLLLELPVIRDDEPQVRPGGQTPDGDPLVRLIFPGHRSCQAARHFLQDLNIRVFEGKGASLRCRGPLGVEVPADVDLACVQGTLAEIKAAKPLSKRPVRPTGPSRGPWKGLDPDTRALLIGLADAARRHTMVRIYYRPKVQTAAGGPQTDRPAQVYRSVAPYSVRWRSVHVDGYDRPPRRVPVLFGYDTYRKTIKMFVADRIQNVAYIGRKFSPQWPVEWESEADGLAHGKEKYIWEVDIPKLDIKRKTAASTNKQALMAVIRWYEKNHSGVRVNRGHYLANVDRYVRKCSEGAMMQRDLEMERLVDRLVQAEGVPQEQRILGKMNQYVDTLVARDTSYDPESGVDCHTYVAMLRKKFGDMPGVTYYEWDEAQEAALIKEIRALDPERFSGAAHRLVTDLQSEGPGGTFGHSFVGVGGHFVDPTLRSRNASQSEIDALDGALSDIYDSSVDALVGEALLSGEMEDMVVHWTNRESFEQILDLGYLNEGSHFSLSLDVPFDKDNDTPYGLLLDKKTVLRSGYKRLPKGSTGVTHLELRYELNGRGRKVYLASSLQAFVTRSGSSARAVIRRLKGKYHQESIPIFAARQPRYATFARPEERKSCLDVDALAAEMVTTGSIGSYEVPLGVPMQKYRKMLGGPKKKKKKRRRQQRENEALTLEFEDIVVREVTPGEATAKDMGYISPKGRVFVSDSLDHDNVGLALMNEFGLMTRGIESISTAMARKGWLKWYGGLSPIRWAGAYGKRKDDPHRICMVTMSGERDERAAKNILAKMPQFSMV